jgi:hypothetical protein
MSLVPRLAYHFLYGYILDNNVKRKPNSPHIDQRITTAHTGAAAAHIWWSIGQSLKYKYIISIISIWFRILYHQEIQ